MSNQYYMVLTDAGRTLEAAALAGGAPVKLKEFAVSDGTAQVSPAQNALQNEVWRGPINTLTNDPANVGWVVAETHIPPEAGGFSIRELGLITEDGTLFAVGRVADMYKPNIADGTALDVHLQATIALANAENVTLLIDPSIVMATREYVDGQIGERTRTALTNDLTLYVRIGGDDSRDGLSEATAKATIAAALASSRDMDFRGANLTVDLGAGTFVVPPVILGPPILSSAASAAQLVLSGAGDATVLDGAMTLYNAGIVAFRNLVRTDGTTATDGSIVWLYSVGFTGVNAERTALTAYRGGVVAFQDNGCFFSGVWKYGLYATGMGNIFVGARAIAMRNNPQFTVFAVAINGGGTISVLGATITGSAIGQRWLAENGGGIYAGAIDPDACLPGSKPGVITPKNSIAAIAGLVSAFVTSSQTGALHASYNVASVAKTAVGTYVVTFLRPLPIATYVPIFSGLSALQTAEVPVANKTVAGFTIITKNNAVNADMAFTALCMA